MLHFPEKCEAPGLTTSQMEGATKRWEMDKCNPGEPSENVLLLCEIMSIYIFPYHVLPTHLFYVITSNHAGLKTVYATNF